MEINYLYKISLILQVIFDWNIFLENKSVLAAYIDPNTGGMLFQILAVLFGIISGALLLFSGKIKSLFYRVKRRTRNSKEK